jgi:hypothetical protein
MNLTLREKNILRSLDFLAEDCVEYLERNYFVIPSVGIYNVNIIVLSFVMDYLHQDHCFDGTRMSKFVMFYREHYIMTLLNQPKRPNVRRVGSEEIDSKNIVSYIKLEELSLAERKEFFIRTLSNLSTDLKKFSTSAENYKPNGKIHFPFLAFIAVYLNPLFCFDTPITDYESEVRNLLSEVKYSSLDMNKFFIVFSKMWTEIIIDRIENEPLFLDGIGANF